MADAEDLFFAGEVACFDTKDRDAIKLWRKHGGGIEKDAKDPEVNFWFAESFGKTMESGWLELHNANGRSVPVLRIDWIRDSLRARERQNFAKYILTPDELPHNLYAVYQKQSRQLGVEEAEQEEEDDDIVELVQIQEPRNGASNTPPPQPQQQQQRARKRKVMTEPEVPKTSAKPRKAKARRQLDMEDDEEEEEEEAVSKKSPRRGKRSRRSARQEIIAIPSSSSESSDIEDAATDQPLSKKRQRAAKGSKQKKRKTPKIDLDQLMRETLMEMLNTPAPVPIAPLAPTPSKRRGSPKKR